MALERDDILALPALHEQIRMQSAALMAVASHDIRLSALFATQQRWLMSHIGLSLYYRGVTAGAPTLLYLSTFLAEVKRYGVASRNTADAYIKELIHYKYVTLQQSAHDKRLRPLVPSPRVIESFGGWMQVHLSSLDTLAGGNRLALLSENPPLVAALQPRIADGLLTAKAVRNPERTFSLFTWLDNGGLVMDWLITNMDRAPPEAERVQVPGFSVVEMAARLNLSRTHLARKLRQAEALGSLGWEGRRGHSQLWVSRGFRAEYAAAQAEKLAIIDHACEAVMGPQAAN